MKIQLVLFSLLFSSDLLIEASLFSPSFSDLRNRLEPRLRRKKKPKVQEEVPADQDGFQKYFHEPGGGALSNHYDSRYEHGVLSYEEKQDTQVHMMRAYLDFFRKNNIETWLAHGTLLGWWWNGRMLPWDWDIDTQISGPSLMYIGEHFNGSIYDYSSVDSDPDLSPVVERQYLLDVNPAIVERDRGNGNNVIDARWIDLRNGLYIDVTGLSETDPGGSPGVWACKNYHHYKTTDLYPMRESMYEGVIAKVPYAYDRILAEEYEEKALVMTEFEGHKWHPESKEWIKKTAAEIKQERLDRQAARRQKQEEKAQRKKEKEEKERVEQEAKAKGEERSEEKKEEAEVKEGPSEGEDHGEEEPPKEPSKAKRNPEPDPEPEPFWDDVPGLEKETSGLAHLRHRRLPDAM